MRRNARMAIVLGDQLNRDALLFDELDQQCDVIWMAEVGAESQHVPSHKARIAIFLSAMRHYRDTLREEGWNVDYRSLDDQTNQGTLAAELSSAIERHRPSELIVVLPGEWRVKAALEQVAAEANLPLRLIEDRHFFSTPEAFARHAQGRKQLRLEFFYRELRRETGVLMHDKQPEGGAWNYDAENRGAYGKRGPGELPPPIRIAPDRTTRDVLELVEQRFADHPGSLDAFAWPVTPADARQVLDDFITHRLPLFGQYQDAMWTDEPFLYHSLLSAAMNLKLINPRTIVAAAESAYRRGDVPLAAAEGFIRQILGWREYVRGIYWLNMPEYLDRNALEATAPLPDFYWTGETDANCLRHAIGQTLAHGYAHHIQRLMVTGLFAMLLGVDPRRVHEWYLAVYVDAVEWVELPNTLGMSQYGDGGVMASKPYCASGAYIHRMSNYCQGCRYKPQQAVGDDACPFTTLYWDFLARHAEQLAGNTRMTMQLKNLERKSATELAAIRKQADSLKAKLARTTYLPPQPA